MPSFYIFAKNKVDPKARFKVVRNASHEVNAMAVANKQVDVATNNTESIDRLKAAHPKEAGEIREIWRSPLIPANPIVWRKNLDTDAKEKIYSFFLRYGRTGDLKQITHERDVLTKMSSGWAPFIASSDLQLIPIRQMQVFRDKMKLEANTQVDSKERPRRSPTWTPSLRSWKTWRRFPTSAKLSDHGNHRAPGGLVPGRSSVRVKRTDHGRFPLFVPPILA